jgi:hypothetical protein
LFSLAACGRIGFDTSSGTGPPDARDGGDSSLGDPLVQVDPRTLPPFGTPQLVSVSEPGSEDDDPCLTRDQLEIFFDSARMGGNVLFTARRATLTSAWSTPEPMTALNFAPAEHPYVSIDGLRIYFTSGVNATSDLWMATRPDRDSPFANPARIPNVNSPEEEAMGAVDASERVLMFSSARGGVVIDDLWESRRASISDPWGPPVAVTELNTATYDRAPHLDDYGLVTYFERASELRWAIRTSVASPWTIEGAVDEINAMPSDESDPWLSPDLRTMYFVADTSTTTKDIYVVTR